MGTKVERGSETVLAAEVISTSITTPLIVGGTATSSDLVLKTTSGVGASGSDMIFKVGNNGALTAATINYDGTSTWGTATAAIATTIQSGTGGIIMSNLVKPNAAGGAAQDRALLIGAGTSASPATWSAVDKAAIEFRIKGTGVTGTTYGLYMGMEGATAAEHIPVRGRVYLTGTTGNAHGGHFTLEDDATVGKITGLGTGLRANWVIGNAAQEAGGTYYGAMAEIYCNGSAADPSPVTRYACLAVGVGGDATAAAKCKNAIAFYSSGADATTNMIYTHSHAMGDAAGSIRVLVNGVAKYLKYWDAE